MKQGKIKEIRTLIVRLGILAIIGFIGYLIYSWFNSGTDADDVVLEETPLKVEQIRSILELNTLKFQDEVVVDTFELYQDAGDQIGGTLEKLFDPDQFKHGLSNQYVKRRLTLIVRGELLYGVDLKRKDFQLLPHGDTLEIRIPEPELLSVSITPNKTEMVTENGYWKDYEVVDLKNKAKKKMIRSGERLHLQKRAKEPLEKCLKALVKSNKTIVINYLNQ